MLGGVALLNGGGGGRELAIHLGTANTLVYERGRGIAVCEPSVVAIDSESGAVHAVGDEAKRMIGRTPATISAIRPLRHGVIADFEVTERMLHYFIHRVQHSRFGRSRVIMCVPSSVTEVEPRASMIVDIGGGTSEVAVLSLGSIVVSESLRIGGHDFDDAITLHMKRVHGMAIGQRTAEDMKLELGSAVALEPELSGQVRGRDLVSGLPKTVQITSEELRVAYAEQLQAIVDTVHETLERTPPELASDISDAGIVLAGGGALLKGFDVLLADETPLPVRLADSPLTCVAVGAGRSLEEFETLERMGGRKARALSRTR